MGELSSSDRNAVIVDSVCVTEFVYKQEVRNSIAVLVITVQSTCERQTCDLMTTGCFFWWQVDIVSMLSFNNTFFHPFSITA